MNLTPEKPTDKPPKSGGGGVGAAGGGGGGGESLAEIMFLLDGRI